MTGEGEGPDDERSPVRPKRAPAPIVGIGASAGGIDALQKFFPAVSPEHGLTFVVVQHLDPEHNSTLADLAAIKQDATDYPWSDLRVADDQGVLRTLGTSERYVRSTDTNAFYFMRMLPYRTVDEVIA